MRNGREYDRAYRFWVLMQQTYGKASNEAQDAENKARAIRAELYKAGYFAETS